MKIRGEMEQEQMMNEKEKQKILYELKLRDNSLL